MSNYGRFNGGQHFKALKPNLSNAATETQLKRLNELNIEHAPNITWMKAKEVIKEHLLKRGELKSKHSNERDDRTPD